MNEQIAFGLIATFLLLSGTMVVTERNLVHCVLWLAATLLCTAALYVLLSAPFLAGVQVLLYTGGVVTLMIFGVMLTRRHADVRVENRQSRKIAGGTAALLLFALIAVTTMKTRGLPSEPAPATSTADLGRALFSDHLLAFEVLSMLLLAAMVGAIVVARRRDPRRGSGPRGARSPAAPETSKEQV